MASSSQVEQIKREQHKQEQSPHDHGAHGADYGLAISPPTTVDGVDGYSRSVAGIEIEAIRTGLGERPGAVMAVRDERLTLSACRVGFPMLTRTTIGADRVVVACVDTTREGSRWCELDLRPGTVIAYGPSAEHTAVNLPGLSFTFAVAESALLGRLAEELGLAYRPPSPGEVHELAPGASSRAALEAQQALVAAALRSNGSAGSEADAVLRTMAVALCNDEREQRIGRSSGLDSRRIVHACLDYAEYLDRIPSLGELCLVAHVSERRLREAFTMEYAMPPTQYFRAWGLERAHQRLAGSVSGKVTVTDVASDLGFGHLGRFAGYYRNVFGEMPSKTLHHGAVGQTA